MAFLFGFKHGDDVEPKSEAVIQFLSKSTIVGGGYGGLAAAMIQCAFQDCHLEDYFAKDGTYVCNAETRLEAAQWLLSEGYHLASLLEIKKEFFDAAIDLLVPRELVLLVEYEPVFTLVGES